MRFRKSGKIVDNLYHLGAEESGVYALRGDHGTALISGGMSYILPGVLSQMQEFGIDPSEITTLLILHSHFDHVGIVPYFARKYPAINVIASEAAIATFQKPKAIEYINRYNVLNAGNRVETLSDFDLEWRSDIVAKPVRQGDVIDLGGFILEIFETPGHSNCSISAYEPNHKILFASDAVGIPFADRLFPAMNTNIDQFLASLAKLKPLEVHLFCADHYGFITGEEARTVVSGTIREALSMRAVLTELLRKNGSDIDAAARQGASFTYEQMPGYFLAPEILEGVLRQTLKYIVKTSVIDQ
ncbi:MAG: MBL fold metallo-hydrolase [Syntrophobacteraceae bacterium]|nr:MBL fold metallo-hydrolase [Syntrophobacteraceae bacterium]